MVLTLLLLALLSLQITRRQFRRLQTFLLMEKTEILPFNTYTSNLFECVFTDSKSPEFVCSPSFELAALIAHSHYPSRELVVIRLHSSVVSYQFD